MESHDLVRDGHDVGSPSIVVTALLIGLVDKNLPLIDGKIIIGKNRLPTEITVCTPATTISSLSRAPLGDPDIK